MILVCGEALFDLFAEDGDGGTLTLDARIGGSPFNVAIGLARLEVPVAYFGGLSRDFFGRRLKAALEREGVDTSLVIDSDALTTLSVVGLDASGSPAYSFYGEGAADRLVTPGDLPALAEGIDTIHLGSFSALVPPVGDALLHLVRREHGRRLVAYDPNIRPTVVADLAAWRGRLDALLPNVDLLKISAEDAQTLYPGTDPAELARDWLARGPALVVVTRGREGASAFTATSTASVAGRPVTVADTVGAGDTFQAALLARLGDTAARSRAGLSGLGDDALADLLEYAGRASAITCTRRGADLPRRAELAA
ncbi:carbohydrate kinase [Stappia sp. TSB10P1A]|uniref:carbohydrate kinase family protein n=1 Tax=Stappia sp. TSB10P1A TaxID=2003585 RepID=UPI00164399A1|nr:carbohydrate kinase [Stappia sp. TSB10P1A]